MRTLTKPAVPMTTIPETPPLRIFAAENHEDTLLALRLYLEELGHSVESARTMTEALEKLPGSNVQVLISDIGLPDGTGWELLQRREPPAGCLCHRHERIRDERRQ